MSATMPAVVVHLDETLNRLVGDAGFARKLEYASDTHSFENWLRTEIAFHLSMGTYGYETVGKASYWGHPEAHGRVDIPILSGSSKKPACLVELKVLYNRQGFGKSNRRALEADKQKLKRMRADSKVLLATLVYMQYTERNLWAARKRLQGMQDFMDDALKDLPEAQGKRLRYFDAPVTPCDYRPELYVRFCRIRL